MKKYIVNLLASFHSQKRSKTQKIVSLLLGILFFLVLLPSVFIYLGLPIKNNISIELDRTVEFTVITVSLVIGIFFLIWTTVFQWRIGKGVPAPNAPTQNLVTTGPYGLCRNPIELGAIFYYLGVGTIFGGIVVGIVCFLLGLLVGSAYHKFIEESELEIRFGDEYKQYKESTPFLIPSFRRKERI